MDSNNANDLAEPLLLAQESSYDNEDDFHDAVDSSFASEGSSSFHKADDAEVTAAEAAAAATLAVAARRREGFILPETSGPAAAGVASPSAAAIATTTTATTATTTTSYYGKVSSLSTGMMFPSSRGIVDALPNTSNKPCLLFADHDPLAAVAHICLLEKEMDLWISSSSTSGGGGGGGDGGGFAITQQLLPLNPQLFTVLHVCEPLAKNGDDAGTRILTKINKQQKQQQPPHSSSLTLPVLLHDGNIFQEGKESYIKPSSDDGTDTTWWSTFACLLADYIDESIGKKNLLRPRDAVGLYNMKLFIQRHSHLPALFHKVLTNPSPTQRTARSKQLLSLLKLINSDLQKFDSGPFLCGSQFTLADIIIFPIIERIVVVLSTYRNFWIPPSLTYLIHWYDIVADRPAVRVATSDRTIESQNTYCYERIVRNEYLIEVYECYARHEEKLFKELNDERGRPGVNVYRQVVEEDMRDKSICEGKSHCRHCVIS